MYFFIPVHIMYVTHSAASYILLQPILHAASLGPRIPWSLGALAH